MELNDQLVVSLLNEKEYLMCRHILSGLDEAETETKRDQVSLFPTQLLYRVETVGTFLCLPPYQRREISHKAVGY